MATLSFCCIEKDIYVNPFSNKLFPASLIVTALSGCGGGGGESAAPAPEPTNLAPVVEPIGKQEVLERNSVDVQVSATDSDGSISSYRWEQTSGTSVGELIAEAANLYVYCPITNRA